MVMRGPWWDPAGAELDRLIEFLGQIEQLGGSQSIRQARRDLIESKLKDMAIQHDEAAH